MAYNNNYHVKYDMDTRVVRRLTGNIIDVLAGIGLSEFHDTIMNKKKYSYGNLNLVSLIRKVVTIE